MVRYIGIGLLAGICFASSVFASEKIQFRIDQIMGSLEDRQLAEQLGYYREQMVTGIESWCMEQAECRPELLSVHDLSAFITLINKNESEMRLKILFDRVLKRFRDTDWGRKILNHREIFLKDFNAWCSTRSLECTSGRLSEELLADYMHQWNPVSQSLQAAVSQSKNTGPLLPEPYWSCYDFVNDKDNTIRYGWLYWRDVRIFIDPEKARKKQGPLVYYWHGSNEDWSQIYRVLGHSVIDEIVREGGIVVAPHAGAPKALPWYIMNPSTTGLENDYYLADQLAACAEQLYDIDERRIYSMGFSAGGIQSAAMGRLRSNYIAAIASYSGGQLPWFSLLFSQAPDNYYRAYITYGSRGEDKVPLVEFADTSESLVGYLEWRGFHELMVCQQRRGHTMPYRSMRQGWDYIKDARYQRLTSEQTAEFRKASIKRNEKYWCY